MRIANYLDLPNDVSKDAFIIRIDQTDRRSIEQYILPQAVFDQLSTMLTELGQRLSQNKDIGRFIHGSFGSGKSHLMQILSYMLGKKEIVYDYGDPRLRQLRQNHRWLVEHNILPVTVNMMEKKSLTHELYKAYNSALPPGMTPVEFSDHDRVFSLIDEDAKRMGGIEKLIDQMVKDGAIPTVDFYKRCRDGTIDQKQDLAAKLYHWRNHGHISVLPEDMWLPPQQGFAALSRHAKQHGFTGVAFLIDELIMWLRGERGESYKKQINGLSALVDYDRSHPRELPFFVAVAIQADIASTCPEDVSEKDFRQHLGFIADRFKPWLLLEETDLYEVCHRRVLRCKDSAAEAGLAAAVEQAMKKNAEALQTLQADVRPADVRRLYPFHPALIRALMDVTQSLSRSRSSIQILYALLVEYLPGLEVGQFVPLGTLFDAIFTAENRIELRNAVRSEASLRLARSAAVYERLQPLIKDIARTEDACPYEAKLGCAHCLSHYADESHRKCFQINQLIKSILLMQYSTRPFFTGGASLAQSITVRNLLRLNLSDIRVMTERTGAVRVLGLLKEVAVRAQELSIRGDGPEATVALNIEGVDISEVLKEALQNVQHNDRFSMARDLIDEVLDLKLNGGTEALQTLLWRGSKRKCRVRLCNVRTLQYSGSVNEFDPGPTDFLLLVDYPFDEEPGRSRDDDIEAVQRARNKGRKWTVAWLPKHFDDNARKALDHAAAIELIRNDTRRYLVERYKASDAELARRQLENFQESQKELLRQAIRNNYFQEVIPLGMHEGLDIIPQGISPSDAVNSIATRALDVRYPQHPAFPRSVARADLVRVMEWTIRSALSGQRVDLSVNELNLVRAIALPLELVTAGETAITARVDGRYLRQLLHWCQGRQEFDAREVRALLSGEGKDGFGLSPDVANAMIYYLLQVEGYEALTADGQGLTIDDFARMPDNFRLRKDEVVDHVTWSNARTAAQRLFGLKERRDLPTSPEQAKLARDISAKASELSALLQKQVDGLTAAIRMIRGEPAASRRLKELGDIREKLAPLADAASENAERVRHLARFIDAASDSSLVAGIRGATTEVDSVAELERLRTNIEAVRENGSSDERLVITRLENLLLRDSLTIPIRDKLKELRRSLDAAVSELLRRLNAQTDELRIAEERRKQEERQREQAQRQQGVTEHLPKQHEQAQADGRQAPIGPTGPKQWTWEQTIEVVTRPRMAEQRATGIAKGQVKQKVAQIMEELLTQVDAEAYDVHITLEPQP